MIYIAKPDTWFDVGTKVELIDDYRKSDVSWDAGLFRGWRTCENPKSENLKLGEKHIDEEVCDFDEFEEVSD